METSVGESVGIRIQCCGSRSQTSDRIEDRLVELIHLAPFQSPVECLTYTSAGPPKLNIIPIFGHRVLDGPESQVRFRFRRVGKTYPHPSQEDASRTEGKLSWWNVTGIL